MPKVSIIVPVYNVEKYIEVCLDSLTNQTLKDIEIILIDDGSPDNCGKICDKYAEKDGRILVVHQKNQGVFSARNNGVSIATGDWLAFIDPDDWIELNTLSETLKFAEENDLDIAVWNCWHQYKNKKVQKEKISPDVIILEKEHIRLVQLYLLYRKYCQIKYNLSFGFPGVWGKLYKANIIKQTDVNNLPKMRLGEDVVHNMYINTNAKRVGFINKRWHNYRMQEQSATKAFQTNSLDDVTMRINETKKFINIYYKNDNEIYHCYYHMIINCLYTNSVSYFFHQNNPNSLKYRLSELRQTIDSEPYKTALKMADIKYLGNPQRLFLFFAKRKMAVFILFLMKSRSILSAITGRKI